MQIVDDRARADDFLRDSFLMRRVLRILEPQTQHESMSVRAAFVWGHIGDAAAALAAVVGDGHAVAVGEPYWRQSGPDERGLVDLVATVARFESAGLDLTAIVAASEDDWDRYESLHWRAAVEAGGGDVMQTHRERRDSYLSDQRAELGWAIFTGSVR